MRGLFICRWDDRIGVVLENAFPSSVEAELTDEDRLTIFSTHALSEKAGVMAMRIRRLNILSYYTGLPEGNKTDQYYVALVLDPDENPDQFEERLQEVANIPQVGKPGFEEFFAKSYEQITKYQKISDEQRFAFIFQNKVRRILLDKLTGGPMTKEGLAKWISRQLDREITDIDSLLSPLKKTNLIEEINISKGKKVTLEFVFLIRDCAVIRAPHVELFLSAKKGAIAADLKDKYIEQVEKFFQNYRITSEDVEVIANAIADPDYYSIIQVLREEYVTKEVLPQRIGREIPDLEQKLKWLLENNIITAIKDKKGRIWIILLSDIKFPQFFPEYLVDVIRKRWKEGTIQKEIALKHLQLLRAEYISTLPKYRKQIITNIYANLKQAELEISKNRFDQAATILDNVANNLRDMAERKPAEIIDEVAKLLREDKMKYIEERWENDRAAILEMIRDIEKKDQLKMDEEKRRKEELKKKSKQEATSKGKKEKATAQYVEPEEAEKQAADQAQTDQPAESESPKQKEDKKKKEKPSKEDKKKKKGEDAQPAPVETSGQSQEEILNSLYAEREKSQEEGRTAYEAGNLPDAAKAFKRCLKITEKLVEVGIQEEKENVAIYNQLIEQCESAQQS